MVTAVAAGLLGGHQLDTGWCADGQYVPGALRRAHGNVEVALFLEDRGDQYLRLATVVGMSDDLPRLTASRRSISSVGAVDDTDGSLSASRCPTRRQPAGHVTWAASAFNRIFGHHSSGGSRFQGQRLAELIGTVTDQRRLAGLTAPTTCCGLVDRRSSG